VSAYRPASPDPVSFSAGSWVATGKPPFTVTIAFDPRLLVWHVNQAARRSTKQYKVAFGNPTTTITLT